MRDGRQQNGPTTPSGGASCDAGFILRFRIPVLITVAAATVFLCTQLKDLRLTEDPLGSMYPAGHPFLPALEAIQKMAPEPRMLIAILEVKKGDIYNRETIQKIDSLTRGLMKIHGVLPGGITSLTRGVADYENTSEGLAMDPILGKRWPETKEDFAKLERKVAVNPMGLGRYVSYDGTATMISATLVDEEEAARKSYEQLSEAEKAGLSFEEHRSRVKAALLESLRTGVAEIRSEEQDGLHNLWFMGPQLIEAQMTRTGSVHVPIAAAVMFVVIVAALAAYFRTLRGVLIPVVVMVLSLAASMGMLGVSGIAFNPMALTFPLILGLFSLAYGVLVVEGYEHGYRMTGDKRQALSADYGDTRVAASIVTAGLVLMSLYVSRVPMVKHLAWLGFFWLVGTVGVVVCLVPAMLSLLPAPGGRKTAPDPHAPNAGRFSRFSTVRGRSLAWVLLTAILVAGGFCAKRLEVGDNVPGSSYIPYGDSWNQCFRLLAKKFMGPYQLLVYARAKEESGLLDPEAVNAIGDLSRYLKHHCGARDSIAFDMMVTAARRMLMDGNPKWLTVPVSREQVKGMGELVVEQGGVEDFIDKTFTEATVSPFFPDKETERIDEYAARIQAYIDRHPSDQVDFRLGGGLLGMTKAVNDGTRDTYWKTLAVAFVLVFLCGTLATGSLIRSLVITLPIVAAQGVVWVIMAATGMKINMPVTVVAAAAVGFCAIFGYSRVREMERFPNGPDGSRTDASPGFKRQGSVVFFIGALLFAASLPWFFIGLRVPSQMVLASGMIVLLAAVLSILLGPALTGLCRTGSPAGGSEEGHR
jgi:predicted RND superfamily exporter protein